MEADYSGGQSSLSAVALRGREEGTHDFIFIINNSI
jgi:hypothetical protein